MFDWLTDGIVDWILSTFEKLSLNITGLVDLAKQTPAQFQPEIWNLVLELNTRIVLPVAITIFGCFILADFIRVMDRQQSQGLEMIKMVVIIMFKLALGETILSNIPTLIDGIFDISSHILESGLLNVVDIQVTEQNIGNILEGKSILELFGIWLNVYIMSFINGICVLIAECIIKLRFIEIYAFSAIAAIPLAAIVSSSHEFNILGYSFIKRMCALALQVVFIMVVFIFYTKLISVDGLSIQSSGIETSISNYAGYSILLVIALFQTGGWAKSTFGVH